MVRWQQGLVVATALLFLFLCWHWSEHNVSKWLAASPVESTGKAVNQETMLRSRRLADHLLAEGDDPISIEEAARNLLWSDEPESFLANSGRRLSYNDRYNWLPTTRKAGFSPRYAHAAVLNADQRIFVLGGAIRDIGNQGTTGYLNDVWASDNYGRSFTKVIPRSPRFKPRRGHAAVMNANQVVMFVLGGFCAKDCFMNDWWSSENGDVWHSLGQAPWTARHGHAAVMTSKETLILVGGHDGHRYLNDVWSIQDPAQALVYSSWVRVRDTNRHGDWAPRYGHGVVINSFDIVYLLGGFFAHKQSGRVHCFNDVWKSEDEGVTWSLVLKHAPWAGRYQHSALVNMKDEIFIVGGLQVNLRRCSDVWRSKDDGVTWDLVSPAAPWAARYEHASVIDSNSSMYVIGGMSTGAEKYNDVWRSERTCFDDVKCEGEELVCRDGTNENFEGIPNPVCVGICDRRIFDDCTTDEACVVKTEKAVCVDPCKDQECDNGEVCEVAKRGSEFKDRVVETAEAYCLACGDSKTKFACDKLVQCAWSAEAEACLMKCDKAKSEEQCDSIGNCEYSDGECKNA
mmetsp:Transcript_22323/g.41555  ORF Transcript_22323/g.41555 Transcript_22323/m.41555 type:complete len:571 (-) Transcript_22323:40-1752(-)